MTIIFDGKKVAAEKLVHLREAVALSEQHLKVVALSFADAGSRFYSREKQKVAATVGIEYQVVPLEFTASLPQITDLIAQLTADASVTGIMIQKPRRVSYDKFFAEREVAPDQTFGEWWRSLVSLLPEAKDVDGLAPRVVEKLRDGGTPAILPATMKAVLTSLQGVDLNGKRILILGKTDLLGQPLTAYWQNQGLTVTNWGRKDLREQLAKKEQLTNFDLIVSATGETGLIKGEMLVAGVILVDVGEPKGDLEWTSCLPKASFITPVPGGIGPLTVVELLENACLLSYLPESERV